MTTNKSPGQRAYERDLEKYPLYHDGSKRPEWHQLPRHSQESWNMNPSERSIIYNFIGHKQCDT